MARCFVFGAASTAAIVTHAALRRGRLFATFAGVFVGVHTLAVAALAATLTTPTLQVAFDAANAAMYAWDLGLLLRAALDALVTPRRSTHPPYSRRVTITCATHAHLAVISASTNPLHGGRERPRGLLTRNAHFDSQRTARSARDPRQ
jgi:hypothetical protein